MQNITDSHRGVLFWSPLEEELPSYLQSLYCLESSGSAFSFLPKPSSSQAASTPWKQIWLFPRLLYQAAFGLELPGEKTESLLDLNVIQKHLKIEKKKKKKRKKNFN